jgi:hypothetical protein
MVKSQAQGHIINRDHKSRLTRKRTRNACVHVACSYHTTSTKGDHGRCPYMLVQMVVPGQYGTKNPTCPSTALAYFWLCGDSTPLGSFQGPGTFVWWWASNELLVWLQNSAHNMCGSCCLLATGGCTGGMLLLACPCC